jgi:ABC-type lipoprotein export system ATPase subunit
MIPQTEATTEAREPTDAEPLLAVENLSKSFGTQPLWRDVSFTLNKGESLSICGASGSGKSTLLLAIGGLESVQSGTVTFNGRPVMGGQQAHVEGIRYVFQHYHLIEELTVRENLLLPFSIRFGSKQMPDIWDDVLDLLGLKPFLEQLPTTLSGGERQRATLARAILAKPKLLLADEPTGSLDEATGTRVMELLLRVCQRFCMSLILVTHSEAFAARTDRRMLLKDGFLREQTA